MSKAVSVSLGPSDRPDLGEDDMEDEEEEFLEQKPE